MPNGFASSFLLYKGINRNLCLDSTLQELSLHDFQVEIHNTPGWEVNQQFEENPLLPAVILTEGGRLVGMISRRQSLEHMSRPYEPIIVEVAPEVYRLLDAHQLLLTQLPIHGHLAGDLCLQQVAGAIGQAKNAGRDRVTPHTLV